MPLILLNHCLYAIFVRSRFRFSYLIIFDMALEPIHAMEQRHDWPWFLEMLSDMVHVSNLLRQTENLSMDDQRVSRLFAFDVSAARLNLEALLNACKFDSDVFADVSTPEGKLSSYMYFVQNCKPALQSLHGHNEDASRSFMRCVLISIASRLNVDLLVAACRVLAESTENAWAFADCPSSGCALHDISGFDVRTHRGMLVDIIDGTHFVGAMSTPESKKVFAVDIRSCDLGAAAPAPSPAKWLQRFIAQHAPSQERSQFKFDIELVAGLPVHPDFTDPEHSANSSCGLFVIACFYFKLRFGRFPTSLDFTRANHNVIRLFVVNLLFSRTCCMEPGF